MELRQLEYLVAVAEEGSVTRGAERVRVAQPGVSAQIRRLETELGEALFERSARGVRPTAAGAAVLPHARAALAAVEGVRRVVDELSGLVRGRVALGTVTTYSRLDLVALLAAFHGDHPGVEIALTESASGDLLAAVREGALDLALASLVGPAPEWAATQVVADERIVAAVAAGAGAPAGSRIALEDLAALPLVCPPRGTGVRAAIDAGFAAAGLTVRPALDAGDPARVADLAERGLGVALIPASLAAARSPRLRAMATTPPMRARLALVWRRDGPSGPAARELLARARAAVPPG